VKRVLVPIFINRCPQNCILALGLLCTAMVPYVSEKSKLRNMLNERQLNIYRDIIKERTTIYACGAVLGICLAMLINPKHPCSFVTISMGTAMLYYILAPKSSMMVNHLTTPEQIKEWTKIYQNMQNTFYGLFVIGLCLGYILDRLG